ncbi:MAG: metallophosphoesterase [Lachnospiraceae bacterium]|nr:metallophosphoesterase [Lachnospiraceae bacterium]
MRKTKKRIVIILHIVLLLAAFAAVELYYSYNTLSETEYEISSDKISQPVRMVLIADLHDHSFGTDNVELVDRISKCQPDLILMAGDFLNSYSEDSSAVIILVSQLSEIAPVYFSLGNHEKGFIEAGHPELIEELTASGAVVLDEESAFLAVNGNDILIGGLYDYAFAYDGKGHMDKTAMDQDMLEFLEEFQGSDLFKIMMAHRPDSFIFGEAADTWDIDLVVSGHLHGGQVIIPFVGGLYAGDQGYWPEYDFGDFHFSAVKDMIITRGLGSQREKLPRFNNPPEIVIIDLVEEQ